MIATVRVKVRYLTGFDIDFLNSPTDELGRIKLTRKREPCHLKWSESSAVVAHV